MHWLRGKNTLNRERIRCPTDAKILDMAPKSVIAHQSAVNAPRSTSRQTATSRKESNQHGSSATETTQHRTQNALPIKIMQKNKKRKYQKITANTNYSQALKNSNEQPENSKINRTTR